MPSFAIQAPNLRYFGPVIEAEVMPTSFDAANVQASGDPLPHPVRVAALIDTGASASVIREGIGAQLGLEPIGIRSVHTATAANLACPECTVRMRFTQDFAIETDVIEMSLRQQHIDCLIGRDLLARGVFIYLGSSNAFTLSI